MTEAKQSVKQGIVRKLYERDQLVANDSSESLSQQSTNQQQQQHQEPQQQQQQQHQRRQHQQPLSCAPIDCSVVDVISLCLTFVTCSLFCCGFYLWLFYGLFAAAEVEDSTAGAGAGSSSSASAAGVAGMYILCGSTCLLLLHLVLCFGHVALHSTPSRRELEMFTAFSRQCKMLAGVHNEVDELPPEDYDDDRDGGAGGAPADSGLLVQVSRRR